MISREALRKSTPRDIRMSIRTGEFTSDTTGLGRGYLQGNLAILPSEYATDFLRFCQRNPKPCPLIGVSETGDPFLPTLGDDIDIRTDVPKYNVFKNGEMVEQVADITSLWTEDLVTFVLGCSFSFEEALLNEGVPVRYIEQGKNVSMYKTNLQTTPAGPFHGEVVVSMRPMTVPDAIRAIEITSRFTQAHGAPIHFGDPAAIGIKDIHTPEWGDAVEIKANEIPVFWACGVTPQVAIRNAKPPLCITHSPGHMLISDIRGSDAGKTI
ncbi:MAG: putative hydro-lyase [Alphaproteobacteria bacterium]|nr:putative hydro-lyase [Alphaproteobacteria bacterium]